jgi:hypothetical protein
MDWTPKNRGEFLNYLKKSEGYSQNEVSEVDAYMTNQFGESWTKQEVTTKEPKLTNWQRAKKWFSELFKRKKPKHKVVIERAERASSDGMKTLKKLLPMIGIVIVGVVIYSLIKKGRR